MFVTCESCGTTYRIDQHKLPGKKSFVRCSHCSNPISLKSTEDEQELQSKKIIDCPQCDATYAIPLTNFKNEEINVRCGKCDHIFKVRKTDEALSLDDTDEELSLSEPSEEDPSILEESAAQEKEDLGLEDIEIPKENEIEVDGLFDEDIEEEGAIEETEEEIWDEEIETNEGPEEAEAVKTPTDEYLESIDLSSNEDDDSDDLGLGTVSPENKYKFFLKPGEEQTEGEETNLEDSPSDDSQDWPEIQDETLTTESIDSSVEEDIEEEEQETELTEMPDFDDSSNFTEVETDNGIDDLQDSLVKSDEDTQNSSKSASKAIWAFFVLGVVIILGVGGYLLLIPPERSMDGKTTVQKPKGSKVLIVEPLEGKYVINKNYPKRLFLLQGKLQNFFPKKDKVSGVEVTGYLYDVTGKVLAKSSAFAGNNLTDEQAKSWSKEKIKSFLAFQLGNDNNNLDLDMNQILPFQIVFFEAPDNINKLEARITSYMQSGQKIVLDQE